MNFFQGLQGTSAKELPCLDSNIVRDGPCLNRHQQQLLVKEVNTDEILQALKAMPNEKAPGADGFSVEFFRQYWELIGDDIVQAVLQFFETGKLLKNINCTTVTLIPKVNKVTSISWRMLKEVEELRSYIENPGFIMQHCYQEGNKVADKLATISHTVPSNQEFHEYVDLPNQVKGLMTLDKWSLPSFRRIRKKRNTMTFDQP